MVIVVVGVVTTVDLGPVEADDVAALVSGDEEARGIEPGLAHAPLQVFDRPAALVGQIGEGCGVDREPR